MAISNSKSSTNQTLANDCFDLQDSGGEVSEFQTLVENTPVMLLIFQDRRICYANKMSKILTGYNQDELLTKTNLRSQLQLENKSQILAGKNHTQNQEVELSAKNGRQCWLDCSFRVVQFAQKPATLITAVDITKHKQAQDKIQQVLKQEQNLVSMVSHELRNPLNVISFSSNLLKTHGDRWKPAKVKNYLERVQRGVDTLSLLIDEWLILDKVDKKKLKPEPKPFHLEQFCDNLICDLQLGNDNHQQIEFLYPADDPWVILDRRILQLILTNLLENAIKYSPEGKAIDFTVTCDREEVTFKIEDRGIGIKQSDLKQLFEPFYRGTNVDNIPGHGLGLAVVKKLVKLSGGEINVVSELGKGTQFIISFPQSK